MEVLIDLVFLAMAVVMAIGSSGFVVGFVYLTIRNAFK